MTASLIGAGSALPAPMLQQDLWDGYFREHYADDRVARKVWEHSGITTRHGVVNPLHEDVSSWGTGARMRRFVTEAMPLGKEAIGAALAEQGLAWMPTLSNDVQAVLATDDVKRAGCGVRVRRCRGSAAPLAALAVAVARDHERLGDLVAHRAAVASAGQG